MGKSTFLQDFKAFAMKGNVIDMAVGVIIGGAFGGCRCDNASSRSIGGRSELYGFEMGDEAGRSGGWKRNRCRNLELW